MGGAAIFEGLEASKAVRLGERKSRLKAAVNNRYLENQKLTIFEITYLSQWSLTSEKFTLCHCSFQISQYLISFEEG